MKKIFHKIKSTFSRLGPGFITGAADDDPSGIAAYSIAGAQFGYKLLWLTPLLLPMMIAIQDLCGRIGLCSGMGLAGAIKKYYSKKLLYFAISLLIIANVINIGADLGFIAACLEMILGLPFYYWLIFVTLGTIFLEIFISYKKYSQILKWLSITLLVYPVTALITKQNWTEVARFTFLPYLEFNLPFLLAMVGFIGTTISPYLFFWQAGEEVEEEINDGQIKDFNYRPKIYRRQISHLQKDTIVGMVFSSVIAAFIVLTTASTLHQMGITDIETPQQVALALRPLAGDFAFLLFTVGIIGIGLQAVPILAGGVAYSISETFGFKEGLSKKFSQARIFYLVIAIATVVGALLNIVGINPVRALFYTAVLNGVVSVPLIVVIIKLSGDERVVGKFKAGKKEKTLAWLTFIFILIALLLTLFSVFKH